MAMRPVARKLLFRFHRQVHVRNLTRPMDTPRITVDIILAGYRSERTAWR